MTAPPAGAIFCPFDRSHPASRRDPCSAPLREEPGAWLSLFLWGCQRGQVFAKPPIPLEMPFPAHRLRPCVVALGIQKNPFAASGRTCAGARIMLTKTPVQVVGPANIGAGSASALGPQNINKTRHCFIVVLRFRYLMMLGNLCPSSGTSSRTMFSITETKQ